MNKSLEEFSRIVSRRRSVRAYLPDPIPATKTTALACENFMLALTAAGFLLDDQNRGPAF